MTVFRPVKIGVKGDFHLAKIYDPSGEFTKPKSGFDDL
jgi:hypothetical protein